MIHVYITHEFPSQNGTHANSRQMSDSRYSDGISRTHFCHIALSDMFQKQTIDVQHNYLCSTISVDINQNL